MMLRILKPRLRGATVPTRSRVRKCASRLGLRRSPVASPIRYPVRVPVVGAAPAPSRRSGADALARRSSVLTRASAAWACAARRRYMA